MEPATDTELEQPEALFKLLSKAAVVNNRTMEDEIIAVLTSSLDAEVQAPKNPPHNLLFL